MLASSWLWAVFTVVAAFSQTVRNVTVLTDAGKVQVRGRDELTFSEHRSDLDVEHHPRMLSREPVDDRQDWAIRS